MQKFYYFFLIFLVCACSRYPADVERALELAGDNRAGLEQVLEHYRLNREDRLKYQTACYLIASMPHHETMVGEQIDTYRDILLNDNTISNIDSLWNIVQSTNSAPEVVSHITFVGAAFLKNEIDEAFASWERAPWKDSISFNVFLEYIAPYCVKDEPLFHYRKSLYEKYYPLIAGITSPKEAFFAVYSYFFKQFNHIDAAYPYTMDPMLIDRTRKGNCATHSLYLVSVARALCIPVAFDYVTSWANYSDIGHSWVAYAGNGNQAFTITTNMSSFAEEYDCLSVNNGWVDAAIFKKHFFIDPQSPIYKVDSVKTFAKIWRNTFQPHIRKEIDDGNYLNAMYFNIFSRDVTGLYQNTCERLRITLDQPLRKTVYLCTFLSGQGWAPEDASRPQKKYVEFKHVGENVVYHLMYIDKDEFVPIGNPIVLLPDHTQKILNPDHSQTESIVLWRKYMLTMGWVPRWTEAVGCRFELSNSADFNPANTELVHEIQELPVGIQHIPAHTSKAYRYARFTKPLSKGDDPDNNNYYTLHVAEISFYTNDESGAQKELNGKVTGSWPNNFIHQAFDKDYLTYIGVRGNRWIGLDFGQPQNVTSMEYCLWNDGNFIEKGDQYELLYYDMGWKSLGRQIAEKHYLNYDNIPKNALLWLKNHTKGKEERIFTYENGKQIWW